MKQEFFIFLHYLQFGCKAFGCLRTLYFNDFAGFIKYNVFCIVGAQYGNCNKFSL